MTCSRRMIFGSELHGGERLGETVLVDALNVYVARQCDQLTSLRPCFLTKGAQFRQSGVGERDRSSCCHALRDLDVPTLCEILTKARAISASGLTRSTTTRSRGPRKARSRTYRG